MQVREIPLENKPKVYRLFELLPAILTWLVLISPVVLSLISPTIAAAAIIAYILVWFIKAFIMNIRVVQGYRRMRQHQKVNWPQLNIELDNSRDFLESASYSVPAEQNWHHKHLLRLCAQPSTVKTEDVIHAVIIAFYNETRDVLQPTIESILKNNYDMNKVVFVLAYEERAGAATKKLAHELCSEYGHRFMHTICVGHPDGLPNEVKGKGPNITFAGRVLKDWLDKKNIDYERVVVTTLDSDNRPDPNYLACLSYLYVACPDKLHSSFQPLPMYTSNIWDVPAMMRVIATGNTYWNLVLSTRVHMLRNFSAHAQGMKALVETDFWSTRTVVEDGHQYWRTYFRFDGNHEVYPVYLPIYQDAVLSNTYWKTLKAQFVQIRRWAWGASDIPFVIYNGFFEKNKISRFDLWAKTLRLIEGHVSWATASPIIAFAAIIPLHVNSEARTDIVANQLPQIASRIETIALGAVFLTMFLSLKMLPPRPKRYTSRRTVMMVIQWVFLPITPLVYSSLAALYSQTRLFLGKYFGVFDVTDKVVKK